MTTASNEAWRLQKSRLEEPKRIAAAENTAINELINVAVAEETIPSRTEASFRQRADPADPGDFGRVLARAGPEPPRAGDDPDTDR